MFLWKNFSSSWVILLGEIWEIYCYMVLFYIFGCFYSNYYYCSIKIRPERARFFIFPGVIYCKFWIFWIFCMLFSVFKRKKMVFWARFLYFRVRLRRIVRNYWSRFLFFMLFREVIMLFSNIVSIYSRLFWFWLFFTWFCR